MFDWLKRLLGVSPSSQEAAAERYPDAPTSIVIECPGTEPQGSKTEEPPVPWCVRLMLDLNRDGQCVEVTSREQAPWTFGGPGQGVGAVLPFNNDGDNDSAPAGDQEDNLTATELDLEDLTELQIHIEPADRPFPQGWRCLVAVDREDRVRIFNSFQPGARELIGPTSGRYLVALELNAGVNAHAPPVSRLGMEAVGLPSADFDGQVRLGIALFDQAGNQVGEERVAVLRVTPWLMSNHLQPVESVYVLDKHRMLSSPPRADGSPGPPPERRRDATIGPYIDRLRDAVKGALRPLDLDMEDNWLRDMFYGGCTRGPAMATPILQIVRCPSIRGREGEAAVYEEVRRHHVGRDHGWAEPIAPRKHQSDLDSGGNLLCSPPVDGHPFGRIVYGHDDNRPMSEDIVRFLDAQDSQAPFRLDTSWLQVGHIDEVLTFIPWPRGDDPSTTSSHGFRVLVACPSTARMLLEKSANENLLFHGLHQEGARGRTAPRELLNQKKLDTPSFSVADVLRSKVLRDATEVIARHVEGVIATLVKELGIRPQDVMRMPVLFHRYGATPREREAIELKESMLPVLGGGGIGRGRHRREHAAYTPNVVNMLVMTDDTGRAQLCIPKPFGPSSGTHALFDCAFEAYIAHMLAPSGNTIVFIDDFEACHLHTGEIHCTTFEVRRAPDNPAFWEHVKGGGAVSGPVARDGAPIRKPSPPGAHWRNTLNDGAYLDDEVMRLFYHHVRHRFPRANVQLVDPATSFMILNNVNEVEAAAELAALTQNDAALVFFPVNNNRDTSSQGGTHWTLMVYDRGQDRFDYYDSLNREPDGAARAAHARLRELYQSHAGITRMGAPQQQESECGVYVLLITEHLVESQALGTPPNVLGLGAIPNPRQRIRDALRHQ
ncbi:protein-arginine deiminase family protein [Myxococcus sp. Y35]|uniref:protein-arginine deiminase family protein n=1 Tax=Pseudomyxococcus flavus TaxID=3115648 RepID=UPI003CF0BE43